ncbi:MAG: FMN-binding protein, partial [Christensenellaceae bacterium]|nr:FMN-binding protein [Christensenellaceae bacterium]
MANKKKSMPAWLVLTIITIVAALGLSLTHLATKDIIAKRAADEKNQALIALVPDADTFDDMEIPEGLALDSFDAAKKDGALLAYLAQTTVQGYGGPIEVITAMDTEYKLLGISVGGSDFAETAGLGSKVQEPDFVDQYKGIVAPVKMNSDVDQVSGATISSNAVNKGVNSAVENVKIALGDTSGIVTEEEKRANVLAALLPEATAFEAQELPEGSELDSFEIAKAGDEIIAYVAQVTVKGFAGPIEVITATDLDYSLIGIAVGGSDFAETEGLGSKVMDPEFTDAFKGLAVKAELNKNIDQVSGATISSQAVVDAVNKAVNGLKLVNGVEIEEAEETTVVEEEPVVEEVKVELVPGADTYEEQVLANDSLDKLEIAKTGDEILAYVGQLTGKGFAGPIEVKIATDKEFNIIGIEVGGEAFAETPGLGSKVTESEFKDQYIGLSNPIELNKDIDQVSGATISSVVVNDTVNAILENIKAYFSV